MKIRLHKWNTLIYYAATWRTSQPKPKKHQNNHQKKNPYISENGTSMKLFGSSKRFLKSLKNILYFQKWNSALLSPNKKRQKINHPEKKPFLYFLKRKYVLYFQKLNPALFSQSFKDKKVHPIKYFILQETETPKNVLIFQETETLKKLLLFQEVTLKVWKS